MTRVDWSQELELILRRGVELAPGLDDVEIERAERAHGWRFPPDLRALLQQALPVGAQFPDWRQPDEPELRRVLAWPFDGLAFDIEHDGFWWDAWGSRPAVLAEALALARSALEREPRLIPIFGHRYLPAEPALGGNPVFSVYQADVICYGTDLRRYLWTEFGGVPWVQATAAPLRRIRFWSDLVEHV